MAEQKLLDRTRDLMRWKPISPTWPWTATWPPAPRMWPLRAKKDKRLPVVLTKTEVLAVLEQITDPHFRLQAKLLYGTGMRLLECLRLRVKDVEFEKHQIVVRDTKGNEDRVTMLPLQLIPILQEHLRHVKQLHQADLQAGHGAVYLPYALERKYPNANREWGWQYVFPASKLSVDPRSGLTRCRGQQGRSRSWDRNGQV